MSTKMVAVTTAIILNTCDGEASKLPVGSFNPTHEFAVRDRFGFARSRSLCWLLSSDGCRSRSYHRWWPNISWPTVINSSIIIVITTSVLI